MCFSMLAKASFSHCGCLSDLAICSTLVPLYPFSANNVKAASRILSFVDIASSKQLTHISYIAANGN